MRVTAAIVAHPARRDSALAVHDALDREVPLIFDENPVPSADPVQRWVNHRNAWEAALAADPEADAAMVLQDDVLVARDLLAGVEHALSHFPGSASRRPEFLVSAYTGTGRPDQRNVKRALEIARIRGDSWIRTRSLNWGPAIIVPSWTVPAMLDAVEKHVLSHTPPRSNTDYAIGVYYRDVIGWATHYLVPSLVETGKLPSLIGHDKGPIRRAHRFIGSDVSALSVPWGRVPKGGLVTRLDRQR